MASQTSHNDELKVGSMRNLSQNTKWGWYDGSAVRTHLTTEFDHQNLQWREPSLYTLG